MYLDRVTRGKFPVAAQMPSLEPTFYTSGSRPLYPTIVSQLGPYVEEQEGNVSVRIRLNLLCSRSFLSASDRFSECFGFDTRCSQASRVQVGQHGS